jgi:hypothetical protein
LAAGTDLVTRLDRAIDGVRPFKQRRRGSSGGELLASLAEMMADRATAERSAIRLCATTARLAMEGAVPGPAGQAPSCRHPLDGLSATT